MRFLRMLAAAFGLLVLGGLIGNILLPAPASAAAQSDSKDDLTKEIHLLRVFLEKTHAEDAVRQSTVARYQAQHETVASIRDRLEYLHGEVGDIEAESRKISGRITELETNIATNPEPERKSELETQLKEARIEFQGIKERETRLREKESELDGRLRTEESRLGTLEKILQAAPCPPQ